MRLVKETWATASAYPFLITSGNIVTALIAGMFSTAANMYPRRRTKPTDKDTNVAKWVIRTLGERGERVRQIGNFNKESRAKREAKRIWLERNKDGHYPGLSLYWWTSRDGTLNLGAEDYETSWHTGITVVRETDTP
jgi:hypothetical protein